MWYVITASGLDVFGPDTKSRCNAYLRQAIVSGSVPGFLRIVRSADFEGRDNS